MTRAGLVLVLLWAWAPHAIAQEPAPPHMDKRLFLEIEQGDDTQAKGLLLVHLRGVLNGLEAANMTLLGRGQTLLFCAPPGQELTPEWLRVSLDEYLRRFPGIPPNMSIAVVATFAIEDSFPCEQSTGF
jgi:hypothetical protein